MDANIKDYVNLIIFRNFRNNSKFCDTGMFRTISKVTFSPSDITDEN
jgi:hypothetical protein